MRQTIFRPVRTLVAFAYRTDPRRSLAVVILGTAAIGGYAIVALGFKLAVDGVLRSDDAAALRAVSLVAVAVLLMTLAGVASFSLAMRLRDHVSFAFDQRMMDLTLSIPTLDAHESSEYADRLELLRTDQGGLATAVAAVIDAVATLLAVVLTLVLLVGVHPLLGLLLLLPIPSLVVASSTQRRIEEMELGLASKSRQALHLFDLGTTPAMGKELRVFGLGGSVARRVQALVGDAEKTRTRVRFGAEMTRFAGWLVFGAGYAVSVIGLAVLVSHGRATPGDAVMVLTLAARVGGLAQGSFETVVWFSRSLEAVRRYQWLVDFALHARVVAPVGGDDARSPLPASNGVVCKNVSFSYPGSSVDALSDVTVSLRPGQTVAVVGDNGAGKSTLVKLLLGLYQPSAGAIEIDGRDVRTPSPPSVGASVSAAFEDFMRFELMLHESIGVGDIDALGDRQRVEAAVEKAGAGSLVTWLEGGLDTQLGTQFGGVDLSGGEWQKVALARAFMRERVTLLALDEPTASLDANAERELFERYRRASRDANLILLLVSHRFSTVSLADTILVVEAGRIAEAGTHTELIELGGTYAELYQIQAQAYGFVSPPKADAGG